MIESHLRPDQLADGFISMVETYTDLIPDNPEDQSIKDKLGVQSMKTLEAIIDNAGMEYTFEEIIPKAYSRYKNGDHIPNHKTSDVVESFETTKR